MSVGAVTWWRRTADPFRLPSRITIEETLADLSAAFGEPVVTGRLRPGRQLTTARRAILAPPPTRLHVRLRVPAGAHLRFGAGVERTAERGSHPSGVRFAVLVDGHERYARVIEPAAYRRDRHWFDEDVDLGGPHDEREVDLELRTAVAGTAAPGGKPGWSHVRLVRQTTRARQAATPRTPNVVVVLVDTLRADRLGCYGARPSPSPTLDHLAASGRVFEQAISQAPWTLPAVATLLTGLYPQSHGLVADDDALASGHGDPSFLPDTIPTLAARAELGGITTVGVSASPLVSRDTNLARGFETFAEFGWDPDTATRWTPAAEVNATFLRWLARNHDRRFLAYLHYMDVHDPYTPPNALRPAAPPGVRAKIAAGDIHDIAMAINRHGGAPLPDAELAYLQGLYDGEIAAWDGAFGALLDGLAAIGVRDSTVLVVLSDHGEEFQEHGKLKHGIHLYDELLRVPLMIAGPGIAPGRVTVQVQGVDVLPTVAALLGVPVPPGLPGQDLLAAPESRPAYADTRYGITPDGTAARLISVRTLGWKLIAAPANGGFELFDLASDPGERHNRFAERAEGATLAAGLAHFEETAPAAPPPAGEDARLHEKLRTLGYVD